MTTDTTENGLIPQRHKYTMQAPFWCSLHLFHPKNGGRTKNLMQQEVRL